MVKRILMLGLLASLGCSGEVAIEDEGGPDEALSFKGHVCDSASISEMKARQECSSCCSLKVSATTTDPSYLSCLGDCMRAWYNGTQAAY